MRRTIVIVLLLSLAGCAKTGGEAASPKPKETVRDGRMEAASALVAGMFPSVEGSPFVCEAPLQSRTVPVMSCYVKSDTGARLLDIHIGYASTGPYVASLSGELVHTNEHLALPDAKGLRYGPEAKAEVAKRIAQVQLLIEKFTARSLGQPAEMAMRRVPVTVNGNETSAIVWTVYYRGKVGGYLDLEPIGGSVIRIEF